MRPQFASLSSLLNHIKTKSGIVVVIVQLASFSSLLKQTRRRISYADSPNRRFPPKTIRAMFHGLQTYNLISATSRTNTRSCATDHKEIPQNDCHRKQSKSLRMELAAQDRIVVLARSGPPHFQPALGVPNRNGKFAPLRRSSWMAKAGHTIDSAPKIRGPKGR